MYTIDALQANYIEEREKEMREARQAHAAEMARAARIFEASGGQSQSACNTPMASPTTAFGFFAGLFPSFARSAPATPVMSRSTSSAGPGHTVTTTTTTTTTTSGPAQPTSGQKPK